MALRMPRGRALVLYLLIGVLVLAAAAVLARAVIGRLDRSPLQQALAAVPAASARVAFTDWSQVRDALGVDVGSADPSSAQVDRLVRRGFDTDLAGASSLDEAGVALQENFGFSPGNARWEVFAQSRQGASTVLELDDDVDFGDLADHLRDLGYRAPSSDDGVWRGGVDLVSQIDPTITPQLQYVVLLAGRHRVVTSDSAEYAASAASVADGSGSARSAAGVDGVLDMTGRLDDPAAAVVWTRDFACTDLAMSQAAEEDQAQAAQLVSAAGKVSPLAGLTMALGADRRLTVAEQFADSEQADSNLRARARLAVGEAPGRGGSFSDDFRLTGSRSVGSTVLLTLAPRSSSVFPLSGLYSGPVLFATC